MGQISCENQTTDKQYARHCNRITKYRITKFSAEKGGAIALRLRGRIIYCRKTTTPIFYSFAFVEKTKRSLQVVFLNVCLYVSGYATADLYLVCALVQ
jgi:hypothetical protein